MAGEWKYSESCNCWVCSICGSAALNDYAGRSTASNFCPTCGNPMIITMDTLKEDD
jgi:hypothetical protein